MKYSLKYSLNSNYEYMHTLAELANEQRIYEGNAELVYTRTSAVCLNLPLNAEDYGKHRQT